MTKELSLPCPYKVNFDHQNQTYYFITSNEIRYQLVFIDSVGYFSGTTYDGVITKVYSLNIDKLSNKIAKTDTAVQETVACIVTHFFADKENSLVYVCDHSDEKHTARNRKFSKWFRDSNVNNEFVKLDDIIKTPDGIHYTSIIFHADNPFRAFLEVSYYEIVDALNKDE